MEKLCNYCGYKGPVYGTPSSEGVSAPWCPQCGLNNQLVEIIKEKPKRKTLTSKVKSLKRGVIILSILLVLLSGFTIFYIWLSYGLYNL